MSTNYKDPSDVPTGVLAARLDVLANAVANRQDRKFEREFDMRIPAEVDRDADIVLSEAAKRLREMDAPKTQGVAPANCNKRLKASGSPYPRTCRLCGIFGPCKFGEHPES